MVRVKLDFLLWMLCFCGRALLVCSFVVLLAFVFGYVGVLACQYVSCATCFYFNEVTIQEKKRST